MNHPFIFMKSLTHLNSFGHVPVVSAKDLVPVRNGVKVGIKGQLGLDDATDAIVGAEVGVEVGEVAESLVRPITCLNSANCKYVQSQLAIRDSAIAEKLAITECYCEFTKNLIFFKKRTRLAIRNDSVLTNLIASSYCIFLIFRHFYDRALIVHNFFIVQFIVHLRKSHNII